ncbi:MAG: site-specific DNA-methyltransferase [Armatimonadetes bacterium]|nr:site-specific DNA-methyltransferase [Armatimonadota bacterium]
MELIYAGKAEPIDALTGTPGEDIEFIKTYNESDDEWANKLYLGDNLPILKHLYEDRNIRGKVQVVYIDPPYASNQTFRHRRDLGEHAYDDKLSGHEYIEFLRQRLIFLRELLAEEGAIYLHLDENMVFHMKVILDEIFGEKQFRNCITRKKCHSKNYTRKQYGNVSDYILFYSKSNRMKWNRPYEKENVYTFEQRYPKIDPVTGQRYALVPIHAPGSRNGETGKPWRNMLPPPGKHWQVCPSELDRLDEAGEIYWSPTGNPRRKIFADKDRGVPVQDIWLKYMDFRNQNMNESGYPTEKNSMLLRRILEASTEPGDLALDCFCGSGVTLAVARDLGLRWIGADRSGLAIKMTIERLLKTDPSPRAVEEQLSLFDDHESARMIRKQYISFDLYEVATSESNLRSDGVRAFSGSQP